MKKLALVIAIALGMSITSFAQQGGGLFQYGAISDEEYYGAGYFNDRQSGFSLLLPDQHGTTNDYDAPVGSGALLLIGFGAAYAMKKRTSKR